MTNEKYWSEICRVLHENGIHTGTVENSTIPILLDGGVACRIQADGCFCYRPNDLETEEAQELRRWVAPFFKEVSEYISLMEKAPLLNSTSGNESYRLLADFNGVILAGKEMALGGYQFATWDKDASGNAYSQGNYFINGYPAAKADFAIRSGLIEKARLFTPEQMTEMYRCIQDTLDHEYDLTRKQEDLLQDTQEQIADLVPDLSQRVRQAQEQEESSFSHSMI